MVIRVRFKRGRLNREDLRTVVPLRFSLFILYSTDYDRDRANTCTSTCKCFSTGIREAAIIGKELVRIFTGG